MTSEQITDTSPAPQDDEQESPVSYALLNRRDVRSLIFHVLYAAEAFDYQESVGAIVDNINRGFDLDIPLTSDTVTISSGVIQDRDALDERYKPYLDNWRFDRIGVATKLILRLAVWELVNTDTDPRIVINESVELAKCFAEQDSYRFINGVIDRVVKEGDDTSSDGVSS